MPRKRIHQTNAARQAAYRSRKKRSAPTITRVWSMPNKWTFTIPPIARLLKQECGGTGWVDPFAGMNSPAQFTNDLNPAANAASHMDALLFLKSLPSATYNGVLFDPPYSITQARTCYQGLGMNLLTTKPTSMKYWGDCKTEVARILKPQGKAICFGWTSQGIGINRGFEMQQILIVPHGGSKNDTLVTVEVKK
jgi:hypothetical protein